MDQAYENLLSELLLGLLGHTGGAFVAPPASVAGHKPTPVLSSAVDWIDAPQREQLEGLIKIGHHYSQLSSFVEDACGASQNGRRNSMYLVALANGVSEVLDAYRSAVMQIEQNLIQSPAPPLLALQQWLSEFDQLLYQLAKLTREVQHNSLTGSQIMRTIDAKTQSGDPALQVCAARLLWHCHRVMFKQLDAWLVHGLLMDPGQEFFIRQKTLPNSARYSCTQPRNTLFSGSVSLNSNDHSSNPSLEEWHDGFYISLQDLPPRLDLPTADAIMFVGKAVRVLRQPGSSMDAEYTLRIHTELLNFSPVLQALQGRVVLYPSALKHALDGMKNNVASLLWELIQQRCDLAGQLTSMQAYFLLGCGDLYQKFLQDASPLFAAPPRPATAEPDLQLIFQQAAAQTSADADSHFTGVRVRWLDEVRSSNTSSSLPTLHPSLCENTCVPAYDSWDGMFLDWNVIWPLHLFLPPEILRKYGALWQYMLRLKRVQGDLAAAWAVIQSLKRHHKSDQSSISSSTGVGVSARVMGRLGQLRQRMSHFINNLELYVQLDVVDSGSAALRKRIASAKDFTEADGLHRAYVDSLIAQTFLGVKQLMEVIEGIFAETRKLCILVQELDRADSNGVDKVEARFDEIEKDFRAKHNLFFQLIQSSKLQSNSRAPALRQLILRLNFNSFVEQQALQDIHMQPRKVSQ